MKRFFTATAVILVLAMMLILIGCAKAPGEAAAPDAPSAEAQPDASPDAGTSDGFSNDYLVGYCNLGSGMWTMDYWEREAQYVIEDIASLKFQATAANFSADQMYKDVQNQISSGVDAFIIFGAFDSLSPTVSEMSEENEVPFLINCMFPSEQTLEVLNANPYYIGDIATEYYDIGYQVGTLVYENGFRSAIGCGGAIGDPSCDGFADGMTDAFESLGGKVLGFARCSDGTEAPEKSADLVAAHGSEADCIVGQNMDYFTALKGAMDNFDKKVQGFCVDADNTSVEMIKDGSLIAMGGHSAHVGLGAALVVNYLDGCEIRDPEGVAPYFNAMFNFELTADNVDFYKEHFIDGHPLTEEALQSLMYRYNPDVDYDFWVDFLDNYGFDYLYSIYN